MKWLQVLLFNTNYSIEHYSFVYSQIVQSDCYVIPIFQFRPAIKNFQVLLFNINNPCQHYFIYLHTVK